MFYIRKYYFLTYHSIVNSTEITQESTVMTTKRQLNLLVIDF